METVDFEKLKERAKGEVVTIPGWGEELFTCKVKRVSILGLVTKGILPNPLLSAAHSLFYGDNDNKADFGNIAKVMSIIAEETLVEPSIKQLHEIGLDLTDEQQIQLFNFSQRGLKVLEQFRKEQ